MAVRFLDSTMCMCDHCELNASSKVSFICSFEALLFKMCFIRMLFGKHKVTLSASWVSIYVLQCTMVEIYQNHAKEVIYRISFVYISLVDKLYFLDSIFIFLVYSSIPIKAAYEAIYYHITTSSIPDKKIKRTSQPICHKYSYINALLHCSLYVINIAI